MRLRLTCAVVTAALVTATSAGGALSTLTGSAAARQGGDVIVRYVANSGMLVTSGGRRLLIDAPIRDGIPPYATSSAAERALLEGGRAPYADIDAILITHWHDDHFNAAAAAAHLASNPRAIFISSPQVVDLVRTAAPSLLASRLRAVLPAVGQSEPVDVGGVTVRVLRLDHNPSRRFPDQHVGFLIGGPTTVLHVGDADPAADNFVVMRSLPAVDVALLPYWYLADTDSRRFVATTIRPRRMVAMHVPPGEVDAVRGSLRSANVEAVIATTPGSALSIGPAR